MVDLIALRERLACTLAGWSISVSNGRLEARHPDGEKITARLPDELVARARAYALSLPTRT